MIANKGFSGNDNDRNDSIYGSINIDFANLNRDDTLYIGINAQRYSELIRLRHLERMTNEEIAEILCMIMENYYNKHKHAKEEYVKIYRKEELL